MELNCTRKDNVGIVALHGALTAATVDAFREQLRSWQEAESDVLNYVVDMGDVDFMDSAGLGALIATLKRITERGGDLKIAGLQKKPRMVFEITRAYKVFEIYDSVDEAVRSYSD
ncbi:STAS domain-containing protein [Kiritimatiella glycovorans]|uniref:Anti-sigma factor antagonist n=1 Tax=Kiritimatiella glycovorans TaxID=1307763 RepID=A0A0G3EK27_9BACT|nr:STAS domain-containing protein [Kiritimatiella glycovorans]AKJ64494.1 Anti-anti-sigma-B factor [Kiritimatiella glycovorans]